MNRDDFDKEVSPDGFLAHCGQITFPVYEGQYVYRGLQFDCLPSRYVGYKEVNGEVVEVSL